MLELKEAPPCGHETNELVNLCQNLFNEWMFELNFPEKEFWLWNALVEMAKIRQRRVS
jgi:hypothetical protein